MTLDFTEITKFQSRGRTSDVSWDGVEVQRQFELVPFTSAPSALDALLGSVEIEQPPSKDRGPREKWQRRPPAVDTEFDFCFCNQARIDHIDTLKESMASSPSVDFNPDRNEEAVPNVINYKRFMEQVNTVRDEPTGGCIITATYRPLISALRPVFSESDSFEDTNRKRAALFDWIDPQWVPGIKTVTWPDGLAVGFMSAGIRNFFFDATVAIFRALPELLGVLPRGGDPTLADQTGLVPVPDDISSQMAVPVVEFSIRRLLVGRVPWKTINDRVNGVNQETWPSATTVPAATGELRFAGMFPPGTLRFDGTEVVEHYSPATPNKFWFELVHHFQWINLISKPGGQSDVFDPIGQLDPSGVVTWNHVLMTPSNQMITEWGITRNNPGWFYVQKVNLPEWAPWSLTPGLTASGLVEPIGPLFPIVNFDSLFDLNAEA